MRLSLFLSSAAVLTLFAAPASAQFTGVVIPPPAKAAPVAQAPAQTGAERRDSAVRVTMTNMKDWVDSAAATLGVAAAPAGPLATDSARPAMIAPAPAAHVEHAAPAKAAETTEFREGARAPNTATAIPMLALLGLASLVAGLWLLRTRRA